MLFFKVFPVIGVIENIMTSSAYSHFINDFFPNGLVNLVDLSSNIPLIPLTHQF